MSSDKQTIREEIAEYIARKRCGDYSELRISTQSRSFPTIMKICFFAGSYLKEIHESNFAVNAILNNISSMKNGSTAQRLNAIALEIELDVYSLCAKYEAKTRENSYENIDAKLVLSDDFLRRLKNAIDYDGAWFSGLVGFSKCVTKSNSLHFDFFKKHEEILME